MSNDENKKEKLRKYAIDELEEIKSMIPTNLAPNDIVPNEVMEKIKKRTEQALNGIGGI